MIETVSVTAADGAATQGRVSGKIGPALVFVHGVGSTAAIWDAQLRAFGDRYRCVAVELRGNGVPPDPDPALIARRGYANDVRALTASLGIDRFTIVGCSLGGVVAFELWNETASSIEAMVLVGTFASYPNAVAYADGIKDAVREAGDMAAFAHARAAKLGLPPERARETIEQMSCKSVASYLAATDATWTGSYEALLASIDVPALVMCGERDTIAPRVLSEAIASEIPGARLEVVPNAGHVANADNPDLFNEMLGAFLRDTVMLS